MDKIKDFFGSLSKSTKITLISCGSFLLLTFIILLFFVLFPITPSERVILGLGREGIVAASPDNKDETAAIGTVTTAPEMDYNAHMVGTTAVPLDKYDPKSHVTFTKPSITTNVNYIYSGVAIRTGTPGYEDYTQVTTISPEPPDEPATETPSEPVQTNVPEQTPTEPVATSPIEPATEAPSQAPAVTEPPAPSTDAPADPPVVDPPADQNENT